MMVLWAFYGDTFSLLYEALHLAGINLASTLCHTCAEWRGHKDEENTIHFKSSKAFIELLLYTWQIVHRTLIFPLKSFKTGDII